MVNMVFIIINMIDCMWYLYLIQQKQYKHDDEDDNPLKGSVDYCRENGPEFADTLFDYQNMEKKF